MRKVFSWGANSYGQLVQGHRDDLLSPSEIDHKYIPENLCSIEGGGGHTLILTECGDCFACGSNDKGQLGLSHEVKDKNIIHLQQLQLNSKINKAAAGWDFSFVITESKDLYGFGSNSFSQLGSDQVKGSTSTPVKICSGVEQVCCGLRHSIILKENGEIYSCGAAKKGQTGVKFHSNIVPKDIKTFTKVEFPEGAGKVSSVKAGEYHSVALTDTGKMFSWGSNKYGQLGVSPDVPNVFQPMEIPLCNFDDQKVVEIHSGWSHIVAVTEGGQVYTWGRGQYSQLGCEPLEAFNHQPKPLPALPKPQQIATGSEHVLQISDDLVYSWGWNEHGMCGTGDEDDVRQPQAIGCLQKYKAIMVACGAGHSFAVVEDT